jgi:hypothetical protein
MFTIETINHEINIKGNLIDAPKRLLCIPVRPTGDGTPYVEIKDNKCFYVSSERGIEYFRKEINGLDELLFLIFESVTFSMACDFEANNRIENQDTRRQVFAKQLELLGKLDSRWEKRVKKDIEKILENAPYDDLSSERTNYSISLQKQGLKEEDAYKKACEKYPLPKEQTAKIKQPEKSYWSQFLNPN